MSGELTVAIKGGLRKSAKEVLEHTDVLKKTAKNADEAKQIDEVIERLEEDIESFTYKKTKRTTYNQNYKKTDIETNFAFTFYFKKTLNLFKRKQRLTIKKLW